MKEYEAIREIINQCPLNHSRDQFFEEIQCEDPELYIQQKFQGKDFTYDKIIDINGRVLWKSIKNPTSIYWKMGP